MPPITMDRPIWLHHPPVVAIQASATTPGRLEREFAKIFASTQPLNTLLQRLDSYLAADNYNGLVLRLNPAAHVRVRAYLENAANVIVYPMPELTPDGDGGIDIEWENNGRHLALSVMADQPDFISWREPGGRYDGAPATQQLLDKRLEWLSQ